MSEFDVAAVAGARRRGRWSMFRATLPRPALGALVVVAALGVGACATQGAPVQSVAPAPAAAAPAPAPASAPAAPPPVAATDPPSARPPAGTQPSTIAGLELRSEADGTKSHVQRGGEVKLVLDLKGIYEYAWVLDGNVEPQLSQIGERIYIGNGTNGYDVLAGGFTIYRFRAEQPGPVTLTLSKRSRADNAVVKTVRFDVVVD